MPFDVKTNCTCAYIELILLQRSVSSLDSPLVTSYRRILRLTVRGLLLFIYIITWIKFIALFFDLKCCLTKLCSILLRLSLKITAFRLHNIHTQSNKQFTLLCLCVCCAVDLLTWAALRWTNTRFVCLHFHLLQYDLHLNARAEGSAWLALHHSLNLVTSSFDLLRAGRVTAALYLQDRRLTNIQNSGCFFLHI